MILVWCETHVCENDSQFLFFLSMYQIRMYFLGLFVSLTWIWWEGISMWMSNYYWRLSVWLWNPSLLNICCFRLYLKILYIIDLRLQLCICMDDWSQGQECNIISKTVLVLVQCHYLQSEQSLLLVLFYP